MKKEHRKQTFCSWVIDDTRPCLFCCLVLPVTLVLSAHVGQYSFYLYLSESEPRGTSGCHFVLLVKLPWSAAVAAAFPHCKRRICRIDLENEGRGTRKCFLFVDRMLEGFKMNKLKKIIENERSVLELYTIENAWHAVGWPIMAENAIFARFYLLLKNCKI